MEETDIIIGSTFLAYYPENDLGERLIKIELGYNLAFAQRLLSYEKPAWKQLIKKINGSLKEYEAQRG